MSVLVLTSAGGSPGVTTTAVGLTLEWPRDALLADCNRDPDQAVLAGYLAGADPSGRGLPALALVHREGRSLDSEILRATMPLTSAPPYRSLLPGFVHPAGSDLFAPVWPALLDAFQATSAAGTDVIVDGGRIGRTGLPDVLVTRADALVVCCRTSLRSLAGLRLYLPPLQDAAREAGTRVGLLLVGDGQPYGAAEIAAQFQTPIVATVAHDPVAAGVFSEGHPAPRRFAESPYRRSIVAAASRLSALAARPHARQGAS
ncbi:hypothetical protein [Propionicicella superfundia]|uniref:hypothetical protein n=1 Tax=Propionicicella superfundia TaxID=348582 RepID=UPI00048CE8C0|nr:hypothetical protein [Propionicicella superfundia]